MKASQAAILSCTRGSSIAPCAACFSSRHSARLIPPAAPLFGLERGGTESVEALSAGRANRLDNPDMMIGIAARRMSFIKILMKVSCGMLEAWASFPLILPPLVECTTDYVRSDHRSAEMPGHN